MHALYKHCLILFTVFYISFVKCDWTNQHLRNTETNLFEGDIKDVPSYIKSVSSDPTKMSAGLRNTLYRWENGQIPYDFLNDSFSNVQKNLIQYVMEEFHFFTCVRFRPRNSTDSKFIQFIRGNGCSSNVGRTERAGAQNVTLEVPACLNRVDILHELMHVLGFFHEHTRFDRDGYVKIVWENILPNEEHNFKKQHEDNVTSFGTPYDFESILHYKSNAFAKDASRQTIVPIDRDVVIKSKGLSALDIERINHLYECRGTRHKDLKLPRAKPIEDFKDLSDKARSILRDANFSIEPAALLIRNYIETNFSGTWNVALFPSDNIFLEAGDFFVGTTKDLDIGSNVRMHIGEVNKSVRTKNLNCKYWKRVIDKTVAQLPDTDIFLPAVQQLHLDMKPYENSPQGSVYCGKDFALSSASINKCRFELALESHGWITCFIYQH